MSDSRNHDIYLAALDMPPAERAAYLDEVCADGIVDREEIEAMLRTEGRTIDSRGATDRGGASETATRASAASSSTGGQVGPYKLLEKLGEGGFGVVWLAEQKEPIRRKVALKVIKLGMDSDQVIARFEAERQALALMDHPNIAKVYDAGQTPEGRPYFVMELVRGMPIDEYCSEKRLDMNARLELFRTVCGAVQHAHQKGVIHRDIKPNNVMIALGDGKPIPKVIDFGIAKATSAELTQKTLFTEQQQVVGTPEYMSPEQADMTGLDIDTRSDIYSLGVLLYELLTGTRPFDAKELYKKGFLEMMRVIREDEPQKPSTKLSALGDTAQDTADRLHVRNPRTLSSLLRGDIDWIVMKCLEKDRNRRYDTANGLAADIQRYLKSEPVTAGPPSATYRMQKFVRRNRGQVAAAGFVAAALVLGFIGTYVGMVKAQDESERAVEAEQATSRELERANEIKGLIGNMIRSVSPQEIQLMDTELMKRILDDTAKRLEAGEMEDELIVAELSMLVGESYLDIGAPVMGDRHIRRAWETRKRVLGPEHPVALESQNAVAWAHVINRRLQDAVTLFAETAETRRRVLGPEHPDTVRSRCRHADACRMLNPYDLDANVARLREVLVIARRVLKDDPRLGRTLLSLALQLTGGHRFAEAAPLAAEALEVFDRTLPETDPVRLVARAMLATIQVHLGQTDDGVRNSRECAAEAVRVFGPSHPFAWERNASHAELVVGVGRFSEALAFLEPRIDVAALGEHTTFSQAAAAFLLARAYVDTGRHADSRDLIQKLRTAVPKPVWGHADTERRFARTLMQAYDGLGQYDAAREHRVVCQEEYGVTSGPEFEGHYGGDPLYWAALSFLAPETPDLHDPERARDFAGRGVAAEEDEGGENLWYVLDALAQAQHHCGEDAEAIATQERAIAAVPQGADASIADRYREQIEVYRAATEEK